MPSASSTPRRTEALECLSPRASSFCQSCLPAPSWTPRGSSSQTAPPLSSAEEIIMAAKCEMELAAMDKASLARWRGNSTSA